MELPMRLVTAKRLSSMVTALALAGASAVAQTAQERQWCENETGVTVDQRIDGCSAVIKAGREKGEKLAEAFNNRCWARAVLGVLKPALADCNQALRLMPKNAATLGSRAFVFLKMSRFDAAVSDYDAALQINPKGAFALYGRGLARLKNDDAAGESDIA